MQKHVSNKELVALLKEVLAAMEVKRYNRFRIRAYQNAIAVIDSLTVSVYDLWEDGRLDDIPGIGEGLTQHLGDLFSKGVVVEFDCAKKNLPAGMFSLINLRGIGAKKAFRLASYFKLNNYDTAIEQVKKAAAAGKIRVLDGFGEKSESQILDAISEKKKSKNARARLLLFSAEQIAERVVEYMRKCPDVVAIDPLGSLRRRVSTVGDIDLAVAARDSEAVISYFVKFPEIKDIISQGDKMSTVVLKNEAQVDILVSDPKAYGSMLQHFTGSKNHNVLLRTYALERGLSLSQYGIKKKDELKTYSKEPDFYEALELSYIPPEIREGTDEIEQAATGKLPTLVGLIDIKGDLHTHTTASDGLNTLSEMVAAAKELDYEYLGVTDHSPSIASRGLVDVEGMISAKKEEVAEINKNQSDIKVLFGYEINILADATLSLPNDILKELDYVIAAIHTSFGQDKEAMTARLLTAIENPYVTIIGHPTGRLINEREASDIDWRAVLKAVKEHNKILEINAQPARLDLPEDLVREAIGMGIKLIINTDAHDTESLKLMHYGVDVARRGWCTKDNILNTLPLEKFLTIINK